jgi:hypothetical protein
VPVGVCGPLSRRSVPSRPKLAEMGYLLHGPVADPAILWILFALTARDGTHGGDEVAGSLVLQLGTVIGVDEVERSLKNSRGNHGGEDRYRPFWDVGWCAEIRYSDIRVERLGGMAGLNLDGRKWRPFNRLRGTRIWVGGSHVDPEGEMDSLFACLFVRLFVCLLSLLAKETIRWTGYYYSKRDSKRAIRTETYAKRTLYVLSASH